MGENTLFFIQQTAGTCLQRGHEQGSSGYEDGRLSRNIHCDFFNAAGFHLWRSAWACLHQA